MSEPMVRCIDCAKLSVQRAPEWRQRDGFGCCERYPAWLVFHAGKKRECASFAKAPAEVVARREAWMARTGVLPNVTR